MKALYVFSHPDDESFGPGRAMSKQRRAGHEVYLLTLTRGGATKERHRFGYSVDEMGEARRREMDDVARAYDLSGLTVLDLPDSGLKELDPREIERPVQAEIERVRPDVVVTDAVHGVSGFHDHLVTHAVVKRVYAAMREGADYLRRLAFHTISEEQAAQSTYFHLSGSTRGEIDCVVAIDPIDTETARRALDCYATYREVIEKVGIKDRMGDPASFEFFQESFSPPVDDLFDGLS